MEESVRTFGLPRVFRHFLEGLRKITTKSVRINGFCVDINPEKLWNTRHEFQQLTLYSGDVTAENITNVSSELCVCVCVVQG